MQIFRQLAEVPPNFGPTVATIGNFDGVHRGHQWVIAEVVARARALGVRSIAITFDPHPARVLRPESTQPLITPLDEKLELLAATSIVAVLILPFTKEFSRTSARTFATDVLQRVLHVTELHEGENFHFGYQAKAGINSLEMLGREREARQQYEFVVEAWGSADPALQPMVDAARKGARRLRGTGAARKPR